MTDKITDAVAQWDKTEFFRWLNTNVPCLAEPVDHDSKSILNAVETAIDASMWNPRGQEAVTAITVFLHAAGEQGWQLVPVAPTEKMFEAAYEDVYPGDNPGPGEYYEKMLSAAPNYTLDSQEK